MAVLGGVSGFFTALLTGARATVAAFFLLPFRIQFILPWMLGLLYLLFNATTIFGEDAARQTTVLFIYMTSLAFFFALSRERNPLIHVTLGEFVITFGIWLALGTILLKFFPSVGGASAPLTTESIGVLITHAFVVAISEELLFRGAIPSMLPGHPLARQGISAVMFGFFHWSAYSGDWQSIFWAIGLGFIFGVITASHKRGLIIAMGLHAGYNLSVLGFL